MPYQCQVMGCVDCAYNNRQFCIRYLIFILYKRQFFRKMFNIFVKLIFIYFDENYAHYINT